MTVGYYAVPPSPMAKGPKRTEPWPYCHTCVATTPGYRVVLPIADSASPSLTCRACKAKLRAWR